MIPQEPSGTFPLNPAEGYECAESPHTGSPGSGLDQGHTGKGGDAAGFADRSSPVWRQDHRDGNVALERGAVYHNIQNRGVQDT